MFVTIEGIDNVGKTTLCKILKKRLSDDYQVQIVRDPANLTPWNSLKDVVLANRRITAVARAIILLAIRIDAYNRSIQPALDNGDVVLGDRFIDSWFAYQTVKLSGHFRSKKKARSFLKLMNDNCIRNRLFVLPKKTFLLVGDVAETTQRGKWKTKSVFDSIQTQKAVQNNYLQLAQKSKGRIEIIDSRHVSPKKLADVLEDKVRRLLNSK